MYRRGILISINLDTRWINWISNIGILEENDIDKQSFICSLHLIQSPGNYHSPHLLSQFLSHLLVPPSPPSLSTYLSFFIFSPLLILFLKLFLFLSLSHSPLSYPSNYFSLILSNEYLFLIGYRSGFCLSKAQIIESKYLRPSYDAVRGCGLKFCAKMFLECKDFPPPPRFPSPFLPPLPRFPSAKINFHTFLFDCGRLGQVTHLNKSSGIG